MATLRKVSVEPDPIGNPVSGTFDARYASLAAMQAAESKGLVAADIQLDVECHAFASGDVGAVTISGWTTDATRYVRIYAAQNHSGLFTASAYQKIVSAASSACIQVQQMFLRLEGLQFSQSNAGGNAVQSDGVWSGGEIRMQRCILKGASGSNKRGFQWGTGGTILIANCIVYDWLGSGSVGLYALADILAYWYNNTVTDCDLGISGDAGARVRVKNNLVYNCTDDYASSFNAASTNNASDSETAPGSNPITITGDPFVNSASDDFHLDPSSTELIDAGVDLSGDADFPITLDIDSATRAGSWDVGADEITAPAPSDGDGSARVFAGIGAGAFSY